MAHYALINKDNTVVNVITGVDENVIQTNIDGTQIGGSGEAWEKFYESLPWFEGLTCKQTSYNTRANKHLEGKTPFRGNFAGIGYTYDNQFGVFIAPRPFPSWKLDYSTFTWFAPVPMPEPEDGFAFIWSEINKEWIKVAI